MVPYLIFAGLVGAAVAGSAIECNGTCSDDVLFVQLASRKRVDCPDNSTKNPSGGCTCHAGYSGDIVVSHISGQYTGECIAVACPANSAGTSVVSTCTCIPGFQGPTITPTSVSPFYAGNCNQKGSLVIDLQGVTGSIENYQSDKTEENALKKASAILQGKQLLVYDQLCKTQQSQTDPAPCVPSLETQCCGTWYVTKTWLSLTKTGFRPEVAGPPLDWSSGTATLKVLLWPEQGMDKDLVAYTRGLPATAEERSELNTQLASMGIYKESQLAGVDPVQLGVDPIMVSRLESKKAEQATESQAAKVRQAENLKAAEDIQKSTDEARAALAKATQEIAASGQKALSDEAKKNLADATASLDKLQLQAADLDTKQQSDKLDAMIKSGGFVNGYQLTMNQIISYMGLLNGVILVTRLGTTVLPDALMNVAELTPNMASLTDAQLSLALQRTPDREATEFQLQSESASDMQQINSMVEVFGVSSFSAMDRSASAGVAGQSDGVKGAVGGSMGNSKAGGSADSGASQTSEQLSRTTKSLVKSQYYYEPKMKVHIDRSMLQPTPAFRSWSLELSHALCTLRGERDCSRFDPQHASPVTRPTLPPANLSVQVTFIETNLDPALLVTGTSLNPSYVNAVQRAIAANADGVPQQSIQVVVSNPSAAKLNSGTIYDNVQVLAIIPPSSGASGQMTLENLQKAYTRGFLQNAILKQTLAVPNIGVAQIKVAGSVQPNEIVNLYVTSPTSALLTASTRQVQPIKVLLENGPSDSQAAVADFLYNFGTHVCPQALLGGWWRLTASYVSTESHDMVEVEDVTSLAIEDRKSRSHSLSGSVSGGGAAASGGQSSGTSSDSTRALTDGERTALQNAAKTATINVEQSWKGGASGTTPELWRKSLDYSLSSNWKTIDRSVEKCIGVWSFVEDNYTADALCHGWVHMYLTGLGLDSSLAKPEAIARACSSAFYMNILRVSALETQKAQEAAKDRYDSQQCLLHRSFSYFKFSPTQLRANRQQPFSRIRSMSFRFMGQAVSIEHADFLYMAANSSADSSPYQLVSGLGPICADSTPMPISETLAIDPSQCMDFCSASKIECGYAVYNSNGTCMIFQPCGGAMNSVPGIQGSSDVPDLGGCGGAPWMRMMTGSYQDCAQWCIQHPNCTKFQRWISRNTCYIANMSSAVQAVEPNGSPDWQCGIVQDNSTNTYTFPGNGDPFSTSVEIWKRKPSHRTIQGSGAVPGLGGCGGAPWMMNMTGSYQDCAQWCIQHPGCTKFQRWISQNKCWMANMSSAVQAVEPNGSPEWQCGLITQSWSSTTLKVDTYILQEKQDPFGICPQIARVQAPCNGCGPDWGNLAACEAQCNMNDACSYDQGIVVFTEVYKRPDDYSIEFPQGSLVLSFPSPVPVDEFTYTMGSDDQSDPISFKLSAANAASGPYMDLLDKSLPPSWVRQSHTKPVGIPNYYREVPLPWMTLQGASGSGTHWDANQKRCALKQCFCTVEVDGNTTTQKGTFGDDCEQDGAINCATCCNEGQKQTCASLNCKASNPSLIQKVGSGNQLCENPQCSSAVDSQTCCQNKFLAKFFIIQISTKSDKNCGTNADVEAQLTGLDADGNQMVYAGYTKLDNKGYNDFEKGDSDQYPLQSDLDFVPDQVCLRSANSKRWCVEEVYVFSPDLPEPNQVGMAKTWTPISHGYQCHDLL